MDKQEQIIEKNSIKQYAVRLQTSDGVGTGFLYAPDDHEYVYIFTVFHVIHTWLEDNELVLKYQENEITCSESMVDICTLDSFEKLSQCIDSDDEEYKGVRYDVAVLRMSRTAFNDGTVFPETFFCVPEEQIAPEEKFCGYGYPDEKELEIELLGDIQKWEKIEGMYYCKADSITYLSFAEAMRGYSGTGLFAEYQGNFVLLGIVVSCELHEKHKIFRAVGTTEIIEKMQGLGWQSPEKYTKELLQGNNGKIPDDFFDEEIMGWQEECMECLGEEVIKEIEKIFHQISKERTPIEVFQEEPIFDIPKCNKENRSECNCYWAGYLWMLLIQKVLYGNVDGKRNFWNNGQELGLEFICSEGNGKASLANVVASAINNKVLGEKIKGDSILLWQSEQNPRINEIPKSRFKNIVEDIASGTNREVGKGCRQAGYDLLDGEMKEKNYGILHINVLLTRIAKSGCNTIEELKEVIEEALHDIWK